VGFFEGGVVAMFWGRGGVGQGSVHDMQPCHRRIHTVWSQALLPLAGMQAYPGTGSLLPCCSVAPHCQDISQL
jgi:hypothetical protein